MMPIAEIVKEIDAYLSRLIQARELLVDLMTESSQKRLPRRKKNVLVRQAETTISSRRRSAKNKSLSTPLVAHQNQVSVPGDATAQVPRAIPHQASHTEQSAIVQPKRTLEQSMVITRLPASRRISSIRSVRHRTAKPAVATKLDAIKPAIALAGPMSAKIVVVSAEQVQRERERAAHPEVRRPQVRTSGLSGRRAFEALFEAENNPSKAPGQ